MESNPDLHLQEKILAGHLLTNAADRAAAVIDAFVNWLLVGAGGLLGLIISNLDDLVQYVPAASVKSAATWFLVATGLAIFEKYLFSLLSGAAETQPAAVELVQRRADKKVELDFSVVFREIEVATLWPMRWFVRWSFAKTQKGDFPVAARFYFRCAQTQGFLALLILACVLVVLYWIVSGLIG